MGRLVAPATVCGGSWRDVGCCSVPSGDTRLSLLGCRSHGCCRGPLRTWCRSEGEGGACVLSTCSQGRPRVRPCCVELEGMAGAWSFKTASPGGGGSADRCREELGFPVAPGVALSCAPRVGEERLMLTAGPSCPMRLLGPDRPGRPGRPRHPPWDAQRWLAQQARAAPILPSCASPHWRRVGPRPCLEGWCARVQRVPCVALGAPEPCLS